MGEAKRRGTFEQRKAMAIKRNKKERQQMLAAIGAKPTLTIEAKNRQRRGAQLLAMMSVLEGYPAIYHTKHSKSYKKVKP